MKCNGNTQSERVNTANKKELLILGAAVASATAGMYFYTDRKRDWNEPLGLKDRNDQPQKEIALSDSVIEKEVLDASAAMDTPEIGLSESHDGNEAHEFYEKFLK